MTRMKLMAVLVVLLALETPMLALARFDVRSLWEDVRTRDNLGVEEGFAIDLLQYHHVDSPYATPNLTLTDRIDIAVKSSQERAHFFRKQIYGESSSASEHFNEDLTLTSPVYSIQGAYIMRITLGTPSRTFVAIMDTGSDLVWVQCAPCDRCYTQRDRIFVPASSSSYRARPCSDDLCSYLSQMLNPCMNQRNCVYSYSYGDGSSTYGDLASETVTFRSTTGASQSFRGVAFGCGHDNQGSFQTADGLVGLARGPASLVSQLGPRIGHVFSYCLVSYDSAATRSSPLLLGSTGTTRLTYTPMVTNPVQPIFYYVNVEGITIAGTPLSYPSAAFAIDSSGRGGMILDSGTTLTLMDTRAYTPFLARMASLIKYRRVSPPAGLDLCYSLAGVSNPKFPAVVFKFQNVDLALPANNVFVRADSAGHYCLAFAASEGISIFGNVQQQNFQVAYDLANHRVGFAPKTC